MGWWFDGLVDWEYVRKLLEDVIGDRFRQDFHGDSKSRKGGNNQF